MTHRAVKSDVTAGKLCINKLIKTFVYLRRIFKVWVRVVSTSIKDTIQQFKLEIITPLMYCASLLKKTGYNSYYIFLHIHLHFMCFHFPIRQGGGQWRRARKIDDKRKQLLGHDSSIMAIIIEQCSEGHYLVQSRKNGLLSEAGVELQVYRSALGP